MVSMTVSDWRVSGSHPLASITHCVPTLTIGFASDCRGEGCVLKMGFAEKDARAKSPRGYPLYLIRDREKSQARPREAFGEICLAISAAAGKTPHHGNKPGGVDLVNRLALFRE